MLIRLPSKPKPMGYSRPPEEDSPAWTGLIYPIVAAAIALFAFLVLQIQALP